MSPDGVNESKTKITRVAFKVDDISLADSADRLLRPSHFYFIAFLGVVKVFEARDVGPRHLISESFTNIPDKIELKIGAQVTSSDFKYYVSWGCSQSFR